MLYMPLKHGIAAATDRIRRELKKACTDASALQLSPTEEGIGVTFAVPYHPTSTSAASVFEELFKNLHLCPCDAVAWSFPECAQQLKWRDDAQNNAYPGVLLFGRTVSHGGGRESLDAHWFQSFVVGTRWRFAKTYVETYPHEYVLDEWVDESDFERAIRCIERWGVVERFLTARRKYYDVDDYKYWHMGDVRSANPDDQPGLINRSWVDVSRYREDARKLGHTGDTLDDLVRRWQHLLERATQRE